MIPVEVMKSLSYLLGRTISFREEKTILLTLASSLTLRIGWHEPEACFRLLIALPELPFLEELSSHGVVSAIHEATEGLFKAEFSQQNIQLYSIVSTDQAESPGQVAEHIINTALCAEVVYACFKNA